ncbi:uncharacterized protein TRIVIDRAFT_52939 [Trichoderma virens Gv29-8]|uniref:NmrA-like domain-containing protein n=1 Tax=Hypocrea virens (strain Gv29-8 / FGSC 10586) TaxID=413071 RepID=G9MV55_HYPVG|nr:uncharacterized protein TRIVIDRAFT_52939 [Trichoderma virens Gv29-8]EHK21710.1 hypothetical protein TRIVIDRAFT_52939 [Trichoderma virens Gv29-8]
MVRHVTVIGATGIQGGSVIRALVKDGAYSLTAITRNSSSDAARKLASEGIRVIEANLDDIASLKVAFAGTSIIFAATNFFEPFINSGNEQAVEIETTQGINIAKAASATLALEHFIWSTLPNTCRISDGKFAVPHYVSKNKVNDFIKADSTLIKKTTFLWVSVYASNMNYPFYQPFPVPTAAGKNRYIQLQPVGRNSISYSLLVNLISEYRLY